MPMADGEYDVVIMGTGFAECLLSGLLCVAGRWSKLCMCVQCVGGDGLGAKKERVSRDGNRHDCCRQGMEFVLLAMADEPLCDDSSASFIRLHPSEAPQQVQRTHNHNPKA